jgi:hypothetical protein
MSFTIPLSDELAEKTRLRARREGKEIAAFVQEAVEEKLARPVESAASLQQNYNQWHREFQAWIESHAPTGHCVDDSRESIYAGRGE